METKQFYRNHHYFTKKAQALLELAVFGTIIITLLGVLISYGLRYNYQQQMTQRTFRTSLVNSAAGTPKSVSYMAIKDIHVPDPSNQFGIGSFTPVSGSASVTRDYEMNKAPLPNGYDAGNPDVNDTALLPRLQINIDNTPHQFLTSGYRRVTSVPEDSIKKYNYVYGAASIHKYKQTCLQFKNDGRIYEHNYRQTPDENGKFDEIPGCDKYGYDILIIDSSEGQILNYDTAASQCRQITDKAACISQCQKDNMFDPSFKCDETCQPNIEVPWYCQNDSAALKSLFRITPANTRPTDMGLQNDYTEDTTESNTLHKTETPTDITTVDNINSTTIFNRKITYRGYGDKSGSLQEEGDTAAVSITNTTTWQTYQ
jgi:hypothetical protein